MRVVEFDAVRIRNQRYRHWVAVVGLALMACPMLLLALPLVYRPLNTQTTARLVIAGFLVAALYCGYLWLVVWDLQRGPRPSRWTTFRVVWRRVVFRIRDQDLGPAPGQTVALAAFDWLLPTRHWVDRLKLADGIEVVGTEVRFAPAAVRRVWFAPDPAEDYVEPDRPVRFCLAAVELDTGRQLRLIVDETDAELLRRWAVAKGIAVADSDGYQPRPPEPANAA
jgi:hypothetical protein